MEKGTKTIALIGRIDSNNAAAAEQELPRRSRLMRLE